MRGAGSFAVSACLHGGILGWVVFGPGLPAPEAARSIYDREIRPYEKKIVWYNLREKLPEVAPAIALPDTRPPRARVKFNQTVVSGAKDNGRPPQMIWTPEPVVAPDPEGTPLPPVPLPNVVAVATAPRLVRPFVAPPTQPRPDISAAPALPEAPRAASNAVVSVLPLLSPGLSAHPSPQPLPFTPPPDVRMQRQAALLLPDAPAADSATLSNQASLAIVGLNPVITTVVPAVPSSREAGFSAGTVVRPEGGMGGSRTGAQVAVPGLLLRGGVKDDQPSLVARFSPTSRENLMEASRMALGSAASTEARATRVSASPDPRMAGRLVYTVAIQMPNVTSFSGSWIVWFAVREEGAANPANSASAIRPPVPLRKVDPKYIQSAVSDRVEGKVLLRAVIRKDGHVESVVLLKGLDDRLDRSAEEALAKWAFEPAMRDGSAVDVDAVFEIPFRLAPKPIK
jgi:protein TonB